MRERLRELKAAFFRDNALRRARHGVEKALWARPILGGSRFYIAETVELLPDVNAPALGYTTSDNKQWTRLDDEWIDVTQLRSPSLNAPPRGNYESIRGDELRYAREDHTHRTYATNLDDVPFAPEGFIAVVGYEGYVKTALGYVPITHFKEEE